MNIAAFGCLAVMLGVLCGISMPTVDVLKWFLMFLQIFGLKLLLYKKLTYANICAIILALLFATGSIWGYVYDYLQFKDINPIYGSEVELTGTIADLNHRNLVLDCGDKKYTVYFYEDLNEIVVNDEIAVTGRLMNYPVARFKGDYSQRVGMALKGIYGKIYSESITRIGRSEKFTFSKIGSYLQNFVHDKTNRNDYYNNKDFIKALLTGSTDDLDPEIKNNFSITGISHLLAVSGLHFGIFLSFFMFAISISNRNRKLRCGIVVFLMIFYILMVGSRASVFRAAGMIAIGQGLSVAKRKSDPLMSLMISGLFITLIEPYFIVNPGFQMSFIATLGIVLFAEYFKHQFIAVPVITMFFMLPVTIYYNNIVSLESVFVNIISVAIIPIVILMGYISCFIPSAAILANFASSIILNMADFFAGIDFLHISFQSTGVTFALIWLLAVFGIYFFLDGYRVDGTFAALVFIIFVLSYNFWATASAERFSMVNYINIGNCNMEHVVTDDGRHIFMDCGYGADSYARKNGVDEIYMIMITSNNQSLYYGLEEICENRKVQAVLLPESMKNNKDLHLENCRVLYYNQDRYSHKTGNVEVCAKRINGKRCVYVQIYDKVVVIPAHNQKEIMPFSGCDVICVPDKCTDCSDFAAEHNALWFIHPTVDYDYYDYGRKYITSTEGIISMRFDKSRRNPRICR